MWRATASKVVAKTTRDRQKYWRYWCFYAVLCRCDPFLGNISALERDIIAIAFAVSTRSDIFGRGTQIRVSGVTDALAAIFMSIDLAGSPSPLYEADQSTSSV